MKATLSHLAQYRVRSGLMGTTERDGRNGSFILPCPKAQGSLTVIVSDEEGWEHVSVRPYKQDRVPTWTEMCYVKDLFWEPEEVVMQLHPRQSEYVTAHPYVLHLWKPAGTEIPAPPSILVGPIGRWGILP
jgi:hypothetical protein